MISVTSLCDNVNNSKKLWSTEGNSLLVDAFDKRILLDVGRDLEILIHNLDALSVSKDSITDVVLTHGHKGHVGAATAALPFEKAVIRYGEGFGVPKFKHKGGEYKAVGNEKIIPSLNTLTLKSADRVSEISEGRVYAFKSKRDYPFVREEKMQILVDGEYRQDIFSEELNLCIKTSQGLVIISGCAHGGVKNILETAKEIFNDGRIYAFIGGTHILDDVARTQEFISLMRDMDVRLVAPSHCTGVLSRVLIGRELPDRFISLSTGEKILIEE